MTEHKPRRPANAGDLAHLPFRNDAERAESEWLLARETDPAAPAPSPQIASDYAELEDLLADLPSPSSDENWQAEVSSASSAPSRPWWRGAAWKWTAGGAGLAAAAAAVVLLSRPPPGATGREIAIHQEEAGPTGLQISIRRFDAVRSLEEVAVGDRLIVTARPRGAGDLRVYRADGPLVARCPRGPGCRSKASADDELVIEITLEAPVPYHVILVVGADVALPESSIDAFMDAARAASARIETAQPIHVR